MSGLGIDFIASHTGIWVNIWVILALIALVVIIIYFILRRRKLVKMEKELEDLLEEKYEREGTNVESSNSAQSTEGSPTPSESNGMPEYK